MSKIRNLFLVGAAAAAFVTAAAAGAGAAQIVKYHEMNVRAPDGAVAHVRYTGDTPPQIRFEAPTDLDAVAAPMALRGGFFDGPFADMDRISAALDQQAAMLWTMANAPDMLAPNMTGPQGTLNVDLGQLPPGVQGYSVYSVSSGGKTCTQRMSYGYSSHGKPEVQKVSSGDCNAVATAPDASPAPLHVKAPLPAPRPAAASNIIEASL